MAKTCKACGRDLPLEQFYRNGNSYFARCIPCVNAINRAKRAAAAALRVPRPRQYPMRTCGICGATFQPTGTRERWCSVICSIWAHTIVGEPDECWASRLRSARPGYVLVNCRGEKIYGHVVICEATHGPMPPGMYAMHSCDNRGCWNPEHIHPGTPTDNIVDMYQKGRQGVRNYARGDRHGHSRAARTRRAEAAQ